MTENQKYSIARLITIPAVITLAVTLLRLTGELEHWGMPWFGSKPGGQAAIIGISWLPFFFGPYFAIKLAKSGRGWQSAGKAWGYLGLAFLVGVAGGVVITVVQSRGMLAAQIIGFALLLAAAFVPRGGWRALGGTLLAYAFAARIPVLIVMFIAMRGNGGAGWGTHYDRLEAGLAHLPFAEQFLYDAILPQMTAWIAWTVIIGMLAGLILVLLTGAHKHAAASSTGA